MRFTSLFLVAMVVLPMSSALAQNGGDRITGDHFATRSPVIAQNGMAATSHPLASHVAIEILKQGGTAVDAAIAANAAIGFMEPTGNGIGGDLFAIVWDPETRALAGLDASGRSPQGLTRETLSQEIHDRSVMARHDATEETEPLTIPLWGSLPVSVPGAVDGWFMLHERYGTLSIQDVLAPAIHYAREGVPVPQVIAHYWAGNWDRFQQELDLIEEFENARATFFPNDRAPEEGEIFRNQDLADTYQMIADGGRGAFYEGDIAETIDAYMRRIGGYLRKEDFEAHEGTWVELASTNYRGVDVYQIPPANQGLAALQMLNILEDYDLAEMGHNSADYLHVHAEAKKLAFEDRGRFYTDQKFYDVPIEGLLSKEYAAERRELIDMERASTDISYGDPLPYEGDTIYLTVADEDGMMVSLIQSNYVGMGSGLVPDGLGFMLQDRGALFSLEEGHPNVYEPGKRPFHTIIPGFAMKDGEPWLSFGVMGGAMQPQGHVQILCNIIDFGMNVQEAGDAARYRHTGSSQPTGERMTDGGTLSLETGVSDAILEELEARGHNATRGGHFGGYQAILWDRENGVYHGASEMRKDGQAVGY